MPQIMNQKRSKGVNLKKESDLLETWIINLLLYVTTLVEWVED